MKWKWNMQICKLMNNLNKMNKIDLNIDENWTAPSGVGSLKLCMTIR